MAKSSILVALSNEGNIFAGLAEALWAKGGDGEEIARDLARATAAIIWEGALAGKETTSNREALHHEFERLLEGTPL